MTRHPIGPRGSLVAATVVLIAFVVSRVHAVADHAGAFRRPPSASARTRSGPARRHRSATVRRRKRGSICLRPPPNCCRSPASGESARCFSAEDRSQPLDDPTFDDETYSVDASCDQEPCDTVKVTTTPLGLTSPATPST